MPIPIPSSTTMLIVTETPIVTAEESVVTAEESVVTAEESVVTLEMFLLEEVKVVAVVDIKTDHY